MTFKNAKIFSFIITLIVFIAVRGRAFEVPSLTGPIMDQAQILNNTTTQQLDQVLRSVNQSGVMQLQVLTLNSLEGEEIESVAIQITDKWKLGSAEKDNGVLFLISKNDHRMRIEVGQGLEGVLTDLMTKRILDRVVTPWFKSGDYSAGVLEGVRAILSKVTPDANTEALGPAAHAQYDEYSRADHQPSRKSIHLIIFLLFIFVQVILFFIRMSMGGRGLRSGFGSSLGGFSGSSSSSWGSGSGGGGWSGGGGGFSGGGSSGSW